MCGIAGYVDINEQIGPTALRPMLASLQHRGPDAQGFYSHKAFHFCHSRLSIIDLRPESNQPFVSSCGNYVIVYNGEVYNYKELRETHELNCRTLSDTEVILELFIQMGPNHVNLLNGMFAYSIFDVKTKKLYLFRDRLGVKPLFYFFKNGFFAFASEIKALKQVPFIKKNLSINHKAISAYLHMGYIPEPNSIYNEIYKFPAGSVGVFDQNLKLEKYWSLTSQIQEQVCSNEHEAEQRLEGLLHSSIQYRMIADVPVGVFLSGGVDSSLVAALASQHHSGKIKSFTIGFKEGKFDESQYARQVAKHIGTDHEELIISEKEVFHNLDCIYDIYDEPFADQSMLPSLAVCQLAKQNVKVVLTGDGGDEFFYGYGSHIWAERLQNPLWKYSKTFIGPILNRMGPRYKRVSELVNIGTKGFQSHIHAKENGYFSNAELQSLLIQPFCYAQPDFSPSKRKLSALELQAIFEAEVYLKDDLLVKVDRASMHHSIEAREPLLDYRIAELALNLDPKLKKRGDTGKYLLKKILYKYVPQTLVERPKWGFTIPLANWLSNDLAYLKNDYLSEKVVSDLGIVSYPVVNKILNEYTHKPYKIQQIWALILLHKWLKEEA